MDCKHCSAPLGDDDNFCRSCGRKVSRETPVNAREAVKRSVGELAQEGKIIGQEALSLARKGMKTETGKSVAACAAIGAAICVPLPFIGPLTGAVIGGAIGFMRKKI